MYIGLHVKCRLLLSDFNGASLLTTDFLGKYPNIKFHENPSIGAEFLDADGKME